jgi:hypothetical protein
MFLATVFFRIPIYFIGYLLDVKARRALDCCAGSLTSLSSADCAASRDRTINEGNSLERSGRELNEAVWRTSWEKLPAGIRTERVYSAIYRPICCLVVEDLANTVMNIWAH